MPERSTPIIQHVVEKEEQHSKSNRTETVGVMGLGYKGRSSGVENAIVNTPLFSPIKLNCSMDENVIDENEEDVEVGLSFRSSNGMRSTRSTLPEVEAINQNDRIERSSLIVDEFSNIGKDDGEMGLSYSSDTGMSSTPNSLIDSSSGNNNEEVSGTNRKDGSRMNESEVTNNTFSLSVSLPPVQKQIQVEENVKSRDYNTNVLVNKSQIDQNLDFAGEEKEDGESYKSDLMSYGSFVGMNERIEEKRFFFLMGNFYI
jgi:hypothetical protein